MKAKELKRLLKDIPDNMDVVVHCTGSPVVSEIVSCYGGDTKFLPGNYNGVSHPVYVLEIMN